MGLKRDGYLRDGSEVWLDNPNPHRHVFNLYWDNDVVQLLEEDAKALIPLLQEWLNGL